jgi:carbonic anhydrase/acetyltransferase-like protein (isoleucine patch superfamily)
MKAGSVPWLLAKVCEKHKVLFSAIWLWELRFKGAILAPGVRLLGRPIASIAPGSTFSLGKEVYLHSSPRSSPLGCPLPCILRTLSPKSKLVVNANTRMSSATICAGHSIEIGSGTLIGSGALIMDNDFHVREGGLGWHDDVVTGSAPIYVGERVFIGARSIILKGVTVGNDAVIGAASVVTKDVPAGVKVAGNPAKTLS